MSKTISEDVLRGIDEALRIHAPTLRPKFHQCLRSGAVEGPDGGQGTSIHGKLTNSISWEDGEPILRALEAIEKAHGYQTEFAGRRINWLVVCWKRFAEPQQLQP